MTNDRIAEIGQYFEDCGEGSVRTNARDLIAEIDRLRAQVAQLETKLSIERSTLSISETNLSFSQDRRAEDRATIASVEAMHASDGDWTPFCNECGHVYPCATLRVLSAGVVTEPCKREGLTPVLPENAELIVYCSEHGEVGRIPAGGDEYGRAEDLFARHAAGVAHARTGGPVMTDPRAIGDAVEKAYEAGRKSYAAELREQDKVVVDEGDLYALLYQYGGWTRVQKARQALAGAVPRPDEDESEGPDPRG